MAGFKKQQGPHDVSMKERLSLFTWPLGLGTILASLAMFNFGYDVLVFGGVVAMPYFEAEFGECAQTPEGVKCMVPGDVVAIMNATPYAGKLVGIWCAAPLATFLGRKPIFAIIILLSWLGVALQISSHEYIQFTVGRCICYAMTGVCNTILPTYITETAPAPLRGFLGAQMHIQVTLGQIVASAVNTRCSKIAGEASWMIPIGIQFVMPTLMAFGYFFIVESPRWLLSKGRRDAAVAALTKLRGRHATPEAIEEEISELIKDHDNEEKGPWKEVFTGINKRRTWISVVAMAGQQITGQTFITQYGILFYTAMGFTNAYELGLIGHCLALGIAVVTAFVVDAFGRRPLLLTGGIGQAVFLFIVGAAGCVSNPGWPIKNLSVSGFILWGICFSLSWAPLSFIIMAEASSTRIIEKVNLLSVTVSTLIALLISITTPFLVYPQYANLQGKVGFLYGGLAIMMVILAWFFIPELKGRSLEEINILFENRTPTRKFKSAVVEVETVSAAFSSGSETDITAGGLRSAPTTDLGGKEKKGDDTNV